MTGMAACFGSTAYRMPHLYPFEKFAGFNSVAANSPSWLPTTPSNRSKSNQPNLEQSSHSMSSQIQQLRPDQQVERGLQQLWQVVKSTDRLSMSANQLQGALGFFDNRVLSTTQGVTIFRDPRLWNHAELAEEIKLFKANLNARV